MFTLFVSWLLVAGVPGLLMLATLGLGRLERALAQDTISATDVAEFLDQAEAMDVHTLAREGMPEAMDYLHRRQAQRLADTPQPPSRAGAHDPEPYLAASFAGAADAGFPPSAARHSRIDPEFAAPRHVNRV